MRHGDKQLKDEMNALMKELPENVKPFVQAILEKPDFQERLAKLSCVLRKTNQKDPAVKIARYALFIAPDNAKVRRLAYWAVRKSVPLWHFAIVNDEERNSLYGEALKRFVTKDSRVFEIGTGTGILAMLAARAGAKEVITCEKETLVAEAAREIIECNGFKNKIRVVSKELESVELGKDLSEKADLLVSEIVDNGLLGERVIPLIKYAKKKLLKRDARIVPGQVAARGALVDANSALKKYQIDSVCGFDLSPFRRFYPPTVPMGKISVEEHILSDPVELLHLDFQAGPVTEKSRRFMEIVVGEDGSAVGLLQWIRLRFDHDLVLENHPGAPSKTWSPVCHLFPEPVPVKKGDLFRISVEYDDERLYIEPKGVVGKT